MRPLRILVAAALLATASPVLADGSAADTPTNGAGSGSTAVAVTPAPGQTVVVQPAAPASDPLPIEAWILLLVTALGALRGIVHGAAELARLIAKRTATTADDAIADKLEQLDDLLARLGGMLPPPAPPGSTTITTTSVIPPERPPESGTVGARLLAVLAVLALGLAAALAGCGASQRQTTIKAALVTVDAARAAFVAYDSGRQSEIVASATSLEEGRAKLAAYRATRSKIETAFATCYRAIAVAAELNDEPSVAAAAASMAAVQAAVAEFTRPGGS